MSDSAAAQAKTASDDDRNRIVLVEELLKENEQLRRERDEARCVSIHAGGVTIGGGRGRKVCYAKADIFRKGKEKGIAYVVEFDNNNDDDDASMAAGAKMPLEELEDIEIRVCGGAIRIGYIDISIFAKGRFVDDDDLGYSNNYYSRVTAADGDHPGGGGGKVLKVAISEQIDLFMLVEGWPTWKDYVDTISKNNGGSIFLFDLSRKVAAQYPDATITFLEIHFRCDMVSGIIYARRTRRRRQQKQMR